MDGRNVVVTKKMSTLYEEKSINIPYLCYYPNSHGYY